MRHSALDSSITVTSARFSKSNLLLHQQSKPLVEIRSRWKLRDRSGVTDHITEERLQSLLGPGCVGGERPSYSESKGLFGV